MMLHTEEPSSASAGGVTSRKKKGLTVRALNKIQKLFFKCRWDHCYSYDPHSHDRSSDAKHPKEGLGIDVGNGNIRAKSIRYGDGNGTCSPKSCLKKRNIQSPSSTPRYQNGNSGSWRSKSSASSFNGSFNSINTNSINGHALPETLARRNSRKIMFSDSKGRVKPPAMEKNLECSLEELCFGCKKKIEVDRDVVHTKSGHLAKEEEVLMVKVKPGWRQGTKITFEGKEETPGIFPADVTLVITEEEHPLFRRDGDDLEMTIEIPLVKALTGCTIPVTLLGGETMKLEIEDIIYPGYQQKISGQGMLIPDEEQQRRGNLRVLFLIEFPSELTDEQRKDIVRILQDCC